MWLEARLKAYPSSAIIISHDRELLNNSVGAILHLHDGKFDLYSGGYDDFERRRAEKARLLNASRAKQEAERGASSEFRRSLPRKGQQGCAGAIADEAAGQAGAG